MTIRIQFNEVALDCEYKDTSFVRAARTVHGDDIMPIISASQGLYGEVVRLVREAHKKEYGE